MLFTITITVVCWNYYSRMFTLSTPKQQ